MSMDMSQAQAWMAIIGVVFTGLTTLVTLVFAALASRDSKRAAEVTTQARVALSEVHTVVNENFSKQREEIAAQAKQIAYLTNALVSNAAIAQSAESARVMLAGETAATLAASPATPVPVTVVTDKPIPVVVEESQIIKPGERDKR